MVCEPVNVLTSTNFYKNYQRIFSWNDIFNTSVFNSRNLCRVRPKRLIYLLCCWVCAHKKNQSTNARLTFYLFTSDRIPNLPNLNIFFKIKITALKRCECSLPPFYLTLYSIQYLKAIFKIIIGLLYLSQHHWNILVPFEIRWNY